MQIWALVAGGKRERAMNSYVASVLCLQVGRKSSWVKR